MGDRVGVMRRVIATIGAVLLSALAMPLAAQPGSLEGGWIMDQRGRWQGLALTEAGQRKLDAFDRSVDDPSMRCVPTGLIRTAESQAPLEIVEQPQQILMLWEQFNIVRRIYLDGRAAPDWWPLTPLGFSTGRWDGDTLVVETTQLAAHLLNDDGTSFSGGPGTRILERFRTAGDRIEAEFTVEDPVYLRQPASRTFTYDRVPDQMMLDFRCDPLDATGWRLPATGDSLRDLLRWLDLRPPIPERE